MFTIRFFILLIVCIVLAECGIVWQPLLWVAKLCSVVLAVCTIYDGLLLLYASRRIIVSRKHNDRLSLNQPNAISVTLALQVAEWLARRISIVAYDTIPHTFRLSGKEEMRDVGTHTYNVVPVTRGRHEFGVVRCFFRTKWFGLCEARRFVRLPATVKVYPTFHHLDKLEIMATSQNERQGVKRMRRAGNSTDFDQIRPYVAGDDVRTINWRATARAASLMVNTYTDERSQPIIPIVCAGPSMLIATDGISLLDRATSAAIALSSSAIRHYDEAGIIMVTHKGVDAYLAPERATGTVAKMLEATYDFGLPPTESEQVYIKDPDVMPDGVDENTLTNLHNRMNACEADPDYDALATYVQARIKRRSLLVLFANFENIAVAKQSIPALQRMSKRHSLIVVLFENEGVKSVAGAPYATGAKVSGKISEMRFRALCADYLEQQARLAAFLHQQHINVILTAPENLTSAVLQKYLEMKSRALL